MLFRSAIIHLNSAVFQADGNTKTPLYIATIGNGISVVLGYILILGFGPVKGLGLYGAAITNNVRIIVMMLVGLYLLFAKNGMFDRVKIEKTIFNMDMVKDVLKFGVPTASMPDYRELSFKTSMLSLYNRTLCGHIFM